MKITHAAPWIMDLMGKSGNREIRKEEIIDSKGDIKVMSGRINRLPWIIQEVNVTILTCTLA